MHERLQQNYHSECLAMAEHLINQKHMALVTLPHYSSKIIQEAMAINLQENFNREGGLPVQPYLEEHHPYRQAKETTSQTYSSHKSCATVRNNYK
jgi:hypothetical protein